MHFCYSRTEPSNFGVKLVADLSWLAFRDLFSLGAVRNDCNSLPHKLLYNVAKYSLFPSNTGIAVSIALGARGFRQTVCNMSSGAHMKSANILPTYGVA